MGRARRGDPPRPLVAIVALALAGGAPACGGGPASKPPDVIDTSRAPTLADENARPGDPSWRIDDTGPDARLAAYTRPESLRAGERLDVHISASAPTQAKWAIYRLGHYGGAGARKVASGGPIDVRPQPDPRIDPKTGLLECTWSSAFHVDVGASWFSGLYLVRISLPDGSARFAPFIVKDDRKADVVAVLPTATNQAYNEWGGESLYLDTRFKLTAGHAYAVSFDRPFEAGAGAGYLVTQAFPTGQYLEANGYDVTYLADRDVSIDAGALTRARIVLALGHDEYWTRTMRDRYEHARDAGVSLGFLGANMAYWQIRLQPADDGMPDRRQIAYKEAADLDPLRHVDDANVTAGFRSDILKRPENALLGVMSVDWHAVDFPWVVRGASSSWLYQGTGLADNDVIPGVVGVETDATVANGAAPQQLTVVAESPTVGGDTSSLDHHQATIYEVPSKAFVFAAGSIRFAATLAGPRAQVGAQHILRSVLAHAGAKTSHAEQTLGAESNRSFFTADFSQRARQVTTLAGVAGQPGFADGPAASARFAGPTGIALAPDGSLVVADPGNHRIRRVSPSAGTVSTVAGTGARGGDDGPVASAAFADPWGVAVGTDGVVYVTEPQAQRVRRIDPAAGTVRTIAGPPAVVKPAGIALGPDGTLYFIDIIYGGVQAIDHPSDSSPTVRTIALKPGAEGGLGNPTGVTVDGDHLLVVDSGNRSLRRIDLDGTLRTIAGQSDGGFADGSGRKALFWPLLGVGVLDGGRVVLADTGNYRLRLVTPGATPDDTTVRTLAGVARMSHDDGAGDQAGLLLPTGIAVDRASGTVYVSDTGNATIRAVTP